jgi:histidine decarboxylase
MNKADQEKLDALYARFEKLDRYCVGYPCNQEFDYSELFRFLKFSINNVGDPYQGSNYTQNTHDIERDVVNDFAKFTKAPENEHWGYVTNGGTEGNMYGLYLARELQPDGIVYFSEETHYSVPKILRLQHMRNIMLRSREDGSMDLQDLRETLRLYRDAPPIIFANSGTTMKGAVDDIRQIRQIIQELALPRSYIHVDAALSGMIFPFLKDPPAWNFADGADSISISGHKMIGAPLPCGIVLAKKKHVDRIARSVEYVGVMDTTITGSRSAFAPLMLWYALAKLGKKGCRERAERCLEMAEYAVQQLQHHGIAAWRNPSSITVVFPRPPQSLFKKWVIAPHDKIGHIITMPHVTADVVDEFVADYVAALKKSPT